MKTITLAFISTLFATAAIAQDITYDNLDPAIPTVASNPHTMGLDTFSWEGGYIGVHGGYVAGKFHNQYTASDASSGDSTDISDTVSRTGFLGGVQAGYNWQHERSVYGFEIDGQGGSMKKDKVVFDDVVATLKQRNSVDWYTSARARLGYAVSPTAILYTTAGLAYGKVTTGLTATEGTNTASSSWKKNQYGYTVGAGTEIAMTDHLTFKTEYLYTDLGNAKTYDFVNTSYGTRLQSETRFDFHTIRAGFNIKF